MIFLLLFLGGCTATIQFPPVLREGSPCEAIGESDTGTAKVVVEVHRSLEVPLCWTADL